VLSRPYRGFQSVIRSSVDIRRGQGSPVKKCGTGSASITRDIRWHRRLACWRTRLLAARCLSTLQRIRSDGFDFDLIDHFYYPDGVAAVMLGMLLRRPVIITARGTDLNLYPKFPLVRRMMTWASQRAAASIAVSAALGGELLKLGAPSACGCSGTASTSICSGPSTGWRRAGAWADGTVGAVGRPFDRAQGT
jgi:hypothetical protein